MVGGGDYHNVGNVHCQCNWGNGGQWGYCQWGNGVVLPLPVPILTHKQCDLKKLPNVYKSCPKMISLEK